MYVGLFKVIVGVGSTLNVYPEVPLQPNVFVATTLTVLVVFVFPELAAVIFNVLVVIEPGVQV